MKKAVLITFSTKSKKFKNVYERNAFFKQLYGWKQKITKGEKVYYYERKGILQETKFIKIDESTFIVDERDFEKVENFLKKWRDKVIWKCIKIILEDW